MALAAPASAASQSGEYDGGDYIEDALTDEEAAQGLALACQMRPKTDLVIEIFASSEVCKTKGQNFQARLECGRQAVADTIAFSLSLEGGGALVLPAGPVCERAGARHRPATVLLRSARRPVRQAVIPGA